MFFLLNAAVEASIVLLCAISVKMLTGARDRDARKNNDNNNIIGGLVAAHFRAVQIGDTALPAAATHKSPPSQGVDDRWRATTTPLSTNPLVVTLAVPPESE